MVNHVKMSLVLAMLALAASRCGGSVISPGSSESTSGGGGPGSGGRDAGADADADMDADASLDADASMDADASGPDLPTCVAQSDCLGHAICQKGYCCTGTYSGGKCTCGDGPGCDLMHACCTPLGSPNGTPPACLKSAFCNNLPP
jgi:hypothetical protein